MDLAKCTLLFSGGNVRSKGFLRIVWSSIFRIDKLAERCLFLYLLCFPFYIVNEVK